MKKWNDKKPNIMTAKIQTRRVNISTKGKRLAWRDRKLVRQKAGMIKSLLSMIGSATEDTNSIAVEAEKPPKKANRVNQSWP